MKIFRLVLLAMLFAPAFAAADEGLAKNKVSEATAGDETGIRAAIGRSLPGLLRGALSYPKHRGCFSCHHQALPLFALTRARRAGFEVDEKDLQAIVDFTLRSFRKLDIIRTGRGIPGANTTAGYALGTLAAADHPADNTTAALIQFLIVKQRKDGSWPATAQRPPSEGGMFTTAAMAMDGFNHFGAARDVTPPDVDAARKKALAWLLANTPRTMEDRVFHLRGLVAGTADAKSVAAARDALLDEQGPDGGWSQLPKMPADAYATGSALVALKRAGLDREAPAYRKGIKYLLEAQHKDGYWLVNSRSRPVQSHFDNGDPGGKSQFISFSASGWATLALIEALPAQTRTQPPRESEASPKTDCD